MSYALSADAGASEDAVEMNAEAMRQLELFLESAPHDPVLLTYLMLRAYQAGDVERVGRLLQNVDEAAVDDHMVWVFRTWYHFAVDEFDAAEEAVKEALRLHPLSYMAHHEYAKLQRKLRRPDAEVELHQKLATEGKELRMSLLKRPNVLDLPPALLQQIATYAAACGDDQVAGALARRLEPPP
jgi:tetratricopeptide (TPR) repeat protein